MKTIHDLIKYMWELYPNDNQLDCRIAMLKAFDFISGKYDQELIERKKISDEINQKLTEKGL